MSGAAKSLKTTLALWLSILLLHAEAAGTETLAGILGESVALRVKTSETFKIISWTKHDGSKSSSIALVTFQKPCKRQIPLPTFEKRVNVSEDCKELHLNPLQQEDNGRYTAEIVLQTEEIKNEVFDLQVYKRLQESELRVTCISEGGGNGTWQLNCSIGTLEDGVTFRWSSSVQSKDPIRSYSVISLTRQDLDLNVTCTAKNPVTNASTTVSLKQVCAEKQSATVGWIMAVIAVVLLIIAAVAVSCVLKKRAGRESQLHFAKGSETADPSQSDSVLIGDVPKETEGKKAQPPRKAAKNNQEMPQTIYIPVQHPKQNPLQTDDEKMRKGQCRPPSPGEKTVYSEISKPQEVEDQSIKTIYEMVKNPPSAQSSDFRAFI